MIRFIALFFLFIRIPYWLISRGIADKEKPKTKRSTLTNKLNRYALYAAWLLLGLQIFGLRLLPFSHNIYIQIGGLCLVVVGVVFSVLGRHELGVNWTHAGDSQIKYGHELVTTGVYKFVRHPIYSGVLISYVGGELVAESYLFTFFALFLFAAAYKQARFEEKLLLSYFGIKYEQYMKNTRMLIPYFL